MASQDNPKMTPRLSQDGPKTSPRSAMSFSVTCSEPSQFAAILSHSRFTAISVMAKPKAKEEAERMELVAEAKEEAWEMTRQFSSLMGEAERKQAESEREAGEAMHAAWTAWAEFEEAERKAAAAADAVLDVTGRFEEAVEMAVKVTERYEKAVHMWHKEASERLGSVTSLRRPKHLAKKEAEHLAKKEAIEVDDSSQEPAEHKAKKIAEHKAKAKLKAEIEHEEAEEIGMSVIALREAKFALRQEHSSKKRKLHEH